MWKRSTYACAESDINLLMNMDEAFIQPSIYNTAVRQAFSITDCLAESLLPFWQR